MIVNFSSSLSALPLLFKSSAHTASYLTATVALLLNSGVHPVCTSLSVLVSSNTGAVTVSLRL